MHITFIRKGPGFGAGIRVTAARRTTVENLRAWVYPGNDAKRISRELCPSRSANVVGDRNFGALSDAVFVVLLTVAAWTRFVPLLRSSSRRRRGVRYCNTGTTTSW